MPAAYSAVSLHSLPNDLWIVLESWLPPTPAYPKGGRPLRYPITVRNGPAIGGLIVDALASGAIFSGSYAYPIIVGVIMGFDVAAVLLSIHALQQSGC